jgi:diaminopimelate epimerase
VALHLARAGAARRFVVETDAGPRACVVEGESVEIDMGNLRDEGPVELLVEGRMRKLARVSAGNPHAITFEPVVRAEMGRLGPAIERAAAFPNGTNVEFATLADDGGIDLVVWERGVGFTLACGTGACATAGAACISGARPFDAWIEVRLPGGPLSVRVARSDLRATMRGPARRVFAGEVEIA